MLCYFPDGHIYSSTVRDIMGRDAMIHRPPLRTVKQNNAVLNGKEVGGGSGVVLRWGVSVLGVSVLGCFRNGL